MNPDGMVIELGEGFSDDDVTITIDLEPVWHDGHVSTDYSIGLARIIRIPTSNTARSIGFQVGPPHRSRSAGVTLGASSGNRIRCAVDPAGTLTVTTVGDEPIF